MNRKQYGQKLNLILEEVNIKRIAFPIGNTEKGKYKIVWDGKQFRNFLDDQDVGETSDATLEALQETT